MATAPFSREIRRVPKKDRGYSYQGHVLGARTDSLTYHLIKRVVIEEQWIEGTTAPQYIADLRRAVRSRAIRLAVYVSGEDHRVAVIARTDRAVPPVRRGPRPEELLLVVYSANRGIIVTGYQVSSVAATSIPPGATWLR